MAFACIVSYIMYNCTVSPLANWNIHLCYGGGLRGAEVSTTFLSRLSLDEEHHAVRITLSQPTQILKIYVFIPVLDTNCLH